MLFNSWTKIKYSGITLLLYLLPSMLWHCWLGSSKGIRPIKNWVVGCWHGYLSWARCRFVYGSADATATHYLLLQKKFVVTAATVMNAEINFKTYAYICF